MYSCVDYLMNKLENNNEYKEYRKFMDMYVNKDVYITSDYLTINFLSYLNKEVCIGSINHNPQSLKIINEEGQTEELCILALSKDPSVIKYVKNKDLYNKLKSIL